MKITNAAELTKRIEKLRKAQKIFATFSQEKVDKIFKAAAIAAKAIIRPQVKAIIAVSVIIFPSKLIKSKTKII